MPRAFLLKKDLYSALDLAAMELAFPAKRDSIQRDTKCPSHPANLPFFPSPSHPWPPIGLPTASVASPSTLDVQHTHTHRQPLAPKNPDALWLNAVNALPGFPTVYLPLPHHGPWSLQATQPTFPPASTGPFLPARHNLQTISNQPLPVRTCKPLSTPFDIDTILGNAATHPATLAEKLGKIEEECDDHEMEELDIKPNSSLSGRRSSPRYQCSECKKSYSTVSGLTKHREFHCSVLHQQSFQCKNKSCNRLYGTIGALKMHMRTHTLPNQCTVCGRRFSRPWLLKGHMRTHSGEKPFHCNQCLRPFADRSNLRAHLQTHAEIKKYKCQLCQKTFSRMSLLNKHQSGTCRPHRPRTGSSLEGTLV
ncbi:zinc finger protein SNAI2-like [Paramacrobiotus metropolitanus]|uniref:zinc finger protein SNAI2-like n=1 Tax=Paramacrobiotus metropolitanus TaxID=2943436 RepID=UPI00244632EA|nr:zinc finger protein SNAI2-like [Paramacrobiotus metropolitanus]